MRSHAPARLTWAVRGALVCIVVGLTTVLAIALWLRPYDADGKPLRLATHQQLGLPPCTFYRTTGLPCPSCGMTTSFAFLVRGDIKDSMRANAIGTLLALFCLAMIPWCLASLVRGRLLGIRSPERVLTWIVGVFIALLLLRWAVVLGWIWLSGARP